MVEKMVFKYKLYMYKCINVLIYILFKYIYINLFYIKFIHYSMKRVCVDINLYFSFFCSLNTIVTCGEQLNNIYIYIYISLFMYVLDIKMYCLFVLV